MLAKSLLLLASATLSLAKPVPLPNDFSCATHPQAVLPTTGGARELPSPPPDVVLKHIALGVGIQNYTCAEAGATPSAIGAIAMLYDVTKLYPKTEGEKAHWSAIPSLSKPKTHAKLPFKTKAPYFPKNPAPSSGMGSGPVSYPYLGNHYFNSDGVPVFDLKTTGEVLYSKKLDGVNAPSPMDVDWLYLGDAGGSVGVKYVYRVNTAGGTYPSCLSKGVQTSIYATYYWFYG